MLAYVILCAAQGVFRGVIYAKVLLDSEPRARKPEISACDAMTAASAARINSGQRKESSGTYFRV